MKKRFVTGMIAAAMMMAILTGCGQRSEDMQTMRETVSVEQEEETTDADKDLTDFEKQDAEQKKEINKIEGKSSETEVTCSALEKKAKEKKEDRGNTAPATPTAPATSTVPAKEEVLKVEEDVQAAAVQEAAAQTVAQETVQQNTNVFYAEGNYNFAQNQIQIFPGLVYYDGEGNLIAECYVTSGYNTPAYNIEVPYLGFADGNGNLIAEASFGYMNVECIGSYSGIVYTFTFGSDCVVNPNADLSVLNCQYLVNNNY